jgi:hypothetical protein
MKRDRNCGPAAKKAFFSGKDQSGDSIPPTHPPSEQGRNIYLFIYLSTAIYSL